MQRQDVIASERRPGYLLSNGLLAIFNGETADDLGAAQNAGGGRMPIEDEFGPPLSFTSECDRGHGDRKTTQ